MHLKCRRPQFDSWVGKIPWRRDRLPTPVFLGFPGGSAGKESPCKVGDWGLIPGLWRSPRKVNGYPLQYSGLENSTDCIVMGLQRVWHDWMTFTFHFVFDQSFWLRVLPGGACIVQPRWMPARRILGGGRTRGIFFWPFPNSSCWWWLISSLFLTRASCHKTIHANGYCGAWVVSVSVLP